MKGKDLKVQYRTLNLKGTEYKVEYTLNALVELEEIYGNITEIDKIFQDFNLKTLRNLLYCGLLEHHEVSIKEAGTLFDFEKMQEIMEVLTDAFKQAFPEVEQQGK